MSYPRHFAAVLLIGGIVVGNPFVAGGAAKEKPVIKTGQELPAPGEKVFWTDPVDIRERDLLHGQGGAEHQPHNTSGYRFTKEDLDGTNPKFNVQDEEGNKWKIKVGDEARPETTASRFVWAVGFRTDEDYFLPEVRVDGLPPKVHRGQQFISPDGVMRGARLKRNIPGEKKLGIWKWDDSPFTGTREWNALRVMMALINNWDLKDVNNSIYETGKKDSRQYIYVVSDLGASFGPSHLDMGHKKDKGDIKSFRQSDFLIRQHANSVSFATPGAPSPAFLVAPHEFFSRLHMQWLGRDIPREDIRWIASILVKLSPMQIRDAFRAGGYSPAEVEEFAALMENRIASLTEL